MNKEKVYEFLREQRIEFEITEHGAVFTMEELESTELPHPEAGGKNMFLRDDKKQHYYLVTVRGLKRLDIKAFRKAFGLRPLRFASEEELEELLHLKKGEVTPFGLLNDEEHKVEFFMDEDFFLDDGLIGVHPNDNTATVWLKAKSMMTVLRQLGVTVYSVKIPVQL